jgi:hypothetical protein
MRQGFRHLSHQRRQVSRAIIRIIGSLLREQSEHIHDSGVTLKWRLRCTSRRRVVAYFGFSSWRPAPFHFLHHGLVVGQHNSAKSGELFGASQSGDEIGKCGIQGSDTTREAERVAEEAF